MRVVHALSCHKKNVTVCLCRFMLTLLLLRRRPLHVVTGKHPMSLYTSGVVLALTLSLCAARGALAQQEEAPRHGSDTEDPLPAQRRYSLFGASRGAGGGRNAEEEEPIMKPASPVRRHSHLARSRIVRSHAHTAPLSLPPIPPRTHLHTPPHHQRSREVFTSLSIAIYFFSSCCCL